MVLGDLVVVEHGWSRPGGLELGPGGVGGHWIRLVVGQCTEFQDSDLSFYKFIGNEFKVLV